MNWFILSLITILFWSGSDVFSKVGSREDDIYSHWKMVIAVGIVMGAHAIYLLATGAEFYWSDIIVYLPASSMYIISMILGYAGLRYIELSISSPICNSSGAVAALLCFIFLGDTMTWLQFLAVALVTVSVYGLSYIEKKRDDRVREEKGIFVDKKFSKSFLAILFPILYCIIDGVGSFMDPYLFSTGLIDEARGNIAYELTFLMVAVFAFIYVVVIKKQKINLRYEQPKFWAAICETIGQFAYIFAMGANGIVVAPLVSAYCIVSAVWGRIFLKEKLVKSQYWMIAVGAVGMIILGME